MDVEPNDSTQNLKQKIMINEENLIERLSDIDKIYFAGQIPNHKTLSECNIKNKSTIHIEKDIKINNNNVNNNYNSIISSSPFVYNHDNAKNDKRKNHRQLQMTNLSKIKDKNCNEPLIDRSNDFNPKQTECCIL